MADAPHVQMPFCREEEQTLQSDSPADAIIGRLIAKIAQLEEQLYARDLQDYSGQGTDQLAFERWSMQGRHAYCSIACGCCLGGTETDA
jgi:hypothetical protein